jgi:hypothetical protein
MRTAQGIYNKVSGIAEANGVNAIVFSVLYLGTYWLLPFGIVDCVAHRVLTVVGLTSIIISYVIPWGYVYIAGHFTWYTKLYLVGVVIVATITLTIKIGLTGALLVLGSTLAILIVGKYLWGIVR